MTNYLKKIINLTDRVIVSLHKNEFELFFNLGAELTRWSVCFGWHSWQGGASENKCFTDAKPRTTWHELLSTSRKFLAKHKGELKAILSTPPNWIFGWHPFFKRTLCLSITRRFSAYSRLSSNYFFTRHVSNSPHFCMHYTIHWAKNRKIFTLKK